MKFLKRYEGILNKDDCDSVIAYYEKNNQEECEMGYPIRNAPVREFEVTGRGEIFWDNLQEKLIPKVQEKLQDYLKGTKYADSSLYEFTHLSLMRYSESSSKPSHYDSVFDYKDGRDMLRLFAALIYLNDDFDGGQVMFPLQNELIKPEPGLMVIFPTSYMYPHLTIPGFGGERYVLRMHYYVDRGRIL